MGPWTASAKGMLRRLPSRCRTEHRCAAFPAPLPPLQRETKASCVRRASPRLRYGSTQTGTGRTKVDGMRAGLPRTVGTAGTGGPRTVKRPLGEQMRSGRSRQHDARERGNGVALVRGTRNTVATLSDEAVRPIVRGAVSCSDSLVSRPAVPHNMDGPRCSTQRPPASPRQTHGPRRPVRPTFRTASCGGTGGRSPPALRRDRPGSHPLAPRRTYASDAGARTFQRVTVLADGASPQHKGRAEGVRPRAIHEDCSRGLQRKSPARDVEGRDRERLGGRRLEERFAPLVCPVSVAGSNEAMYDRKSRIARFVFDHPFYMRPLVVPPRQTTPSLVHTERVEEHCAILTDYRPCDFAISPLWRWPLPGAG
ncbi:hypothetical protein SCHPADRAFT_946049 [Schizopora paradoxa]|uniref:Uncharacterized protein n=1 Tax=Schizopora paradoxa TaxID=27342 RepID=A0A0H2R3V3_9AGAM|nr:hypothetical protein SCHPADRAFT_946049 [Schizopora paradoxa]